MVRRDDVEFLALRSTTLLPLSRLARLGPEPVARGRRGEPRGAEERRSCLPWNWRCSKPPRGNRCPGEVSVRAEVWAPAPGRRRVLRTSETGQLLDVLGVGGW